jgi:TetR/AcrR family transcriptional repressor of uid operon
MTQRAVPVRRSQRRSATTKERLLDAAAEVFLECGYERCTVADIARRADVTVGAIYSNFRGKADILLEVMRRRLKLQSDLVQSYVKSAPDISQAFLALAHDREAPGMAETRGLLLEIFAASRRDPAVREVVAELLLGMVRFMTSRIRAAQEGGLVDERIHALSLAWLYLIPAVGEAYAEAAGLDLPPQEEWMALLERITNAVAAPGAAPASENPA